MNPVRNKDANIKDIKYVKLGLIMVCYEYNTIEKAEIKTAIATKA